MLPLYHLGMDAFYAIAATLAVSLLALSGLVLLPGHWSEKREMRVVSFAAGVLLATALLQLMPEALEEAGLGSGVFIAVLGGFLGFFYLERFVHGVHEHGPGHEHLPEPPAETDRALASRYLILIGDGLHNFVDGVAIAASFLVSPAVGVATTVAVAAHELPQEVADYGILVRSGYSRRKALVMNFLSGLTAVAGATLTILFGTFIDGYTGYILAVTAGMFLYIAAADLIPAVQRHRPASHTGLVGVPLLLGLALIATTTAVIPDGHADKDSPTPTGRGTEKIQLHAD